MKRNLLRDLAKWWVPRSPILRSVPGGGPIRDSLWRPFVLWCGGALSQPKRALRPELQVWWSGPSPREQWTTEERSLQPVARRRCEAKVRAAAPLSGHSKSSAAALQLPLERPLGPACSILGVLADGGAHKALVGLQFLSGRNRGKPTSGTVAIDRNWLHIGNIPSEAVPCVRLSATIHETCRASGPWSSGSPSSSLPGSSISPRHATPSAPIGSRTWAGNWPRATRSSCSWGPHSIAGEKVPRTFARSTSYLHRAAAVVPAPVPPERPAQVLRCPQDLVACAGPCGVRLPRPGVSARRK